MTARDQSSDAPCVRANFLRLATPPLALAMVLLGVLVVSSGTAQSEQGTGQKASRNLPPEVLRMIPAQGRARKAKRPDPPPVAGSILDGLVLGGKLVSVQGAGPITLTPRQPYHAASGSSLGCQQCLYLTGISSHAVIQEPTPPFEQHIDFTFKKLVPQAMYVVEIQLGYLGPSMSAHLNMYEGAALVQSLPITKGPVLFAFSAPATKTAQFELEADAQPNWNEVWVKSVKLLQVKQ